MYPCKNCGNLVKDYESLRNITSMCWRCNFWLDVYSEKIRPDTKHVVVNGSAYVLCGYSEKPSRYNGFGGDLFCVAHKDGRLEKSNNVWHRGIVPNSFRHIFPDDAKFLQVSEFNELLNNSKG